MTAEIVIITGTDTGVGKTVATAMVALQRTCQGSVVVIKPAQTGIDPTDSSAVGDMDEVHRLTGLSTQEYTCLTEPLAPDTAARRSGQRIPPVSEYADRIRVLAEFESTIVVEGSGGLLVRLDTDGGTLLDMAVELALTHTVSVYVVTRPSLGTLNHTELTVNALRAAGIEPSGLIIGSWPQTPQLADEAGVVDLPRVTGVPIVATIPEGSGQLDRAAFASATPQWWASPVA